MAIITRPQAEAALKRATAAEAKAGQRLAATIHECHRLQVPADETWLLTRAARLSLAAKTHEVEEALNALLALGPVR